MYTSWFESRYGLPLSNMNPRTIQPTQNHILVEIVEPTLEGVILPDGSSVPDVFPRCTVLAVGPEVRDSRIREGARILFRPDCGTGIDKGPPAVVIITEGVVFAVLPEDKAELVLN